jgi:hypothetical protein
VLLAGPSGAAVQEWLLTRSSASSTDGIKVLVPTSDCLTTPLRQGLLVSRRARRRPPASTGGATADPAKGATKWATKHDRRGMPPVVTMDAVAIGDDETGSDGPESPVSLWISPGGGVAAAPLSPPPAASEAAIDGVIDDLLAFVAAGSPHRAPRCGESASVTLEPSDSFQFRTPHASVEQYPDPWPLGRSSVDRTLHPAPDGVATSENGCVSAP